MTVVAEPAFDAVVWDNNHGCGFPAVTVDIVVNSDLLTTAPEIVTFLQAYETDAAMTNAALAFYDDVDASTAEAALMEAAEWFLNEYEEVWTQWVPADIAAKIRAALG
jgi:glycine betaine/proline transport system substrate-binding protein